MNRKELYEIKRRLNPDRTTIGKVFGCYVNTAKNVIAEFETSVGRMDESEKEQGYSCVKFRNVRVRELKEYGQFIIHNS